MSVAFVLDENLEHRVVRLLDERGYQADHVDTLPELGKGAPDRSIAAYSRRQERVIVTYDDDFVTDCDPVTFHGVVYFEDTTLSARQVADVLDEMASQYPPSEFRGVQFGSAEWL